MLNYEIIVFCQWIVKEQMHCGSFFSQFKNVQRSFIIVALSKV